MNRGQAVEAAQVLVNAMADPNDPEPLDERVTLILKIAEFLWEPASAQVPFPGAVRPVQPIGGLPPATYTFNPPVGPQNRSTAEIVGSDPWAEATDARTE